MAEKKENTAVYQRRRIQDADYVPSSEAADTPWVRQPREKGHLSAVAVSVFIVLAAVVLTVSFQTEEEPEGEPAASLRAETAALPGLTGVVPVPDDEDPLLGISARTVTAPVAEYYCMKEDNLVPGVQIYAMDETGAAAMAGARSGDIITALGDCPVESEEELTAAEELLDPGDTVCLTVFREGKYMKLETVLPDE